MRRTFLAAGLNLLIVISFCVGKPLGVAAQRQSRLKPDTIKIDKEPASVVLTDFSLYNTSVPVNSGDGYSLKAPVWSGQEIVLPYDSNFMTFSFSARNNASEPNQFKYMMAGLDKDWVPAGTSRSATYTNLNPGRYTFKVVGANNDGVWNERGASVGIRILPPPWKTWWAYTSYGIIFLGLLIYFRREVIRREQLKSEVEIKRMESQAYSQLDALKSRFFANISHEIRTPLTLIMGPVRKRLAESTSENDRKELAMINYNAERLMSMVNELLDLSRLEAGTLALKPSPEDLVALTSLITSSFHSHAESRGIQLSFQAPVENLTVDVDGDKIEKVLINLLSNALKFTPAKGSVTVAIAENKHPQHGFPYGCVEISVSDTGIGISSDHVERVFDRFYQIDNGVTRKYEGAGIGLALAKEFVELHHGTIELKSQQGKGSVFTVRLPITRSSSAEIRREVSGLTYKQPVNPAQGTIDEEAQLMHGESVLVIEDHADLRRYVRESLQKTYHILEAEDGEKGKQVAADKIPDLIITDLMMPNLGGMELCQMLKSDEMTSHIPVIMLTGKADSRSRIEGLTTGADDYITKPFDMDELKVRIRNLIDSRRRLREKYSLQLSLNPGPVPATSVDDLFLRKVRDIVEQNLAVASFGVEVLASEAAMSTAQLYRKMTALTNFSPNEFIRHMRLQRAADLLGKRAGSVAEIAYESGFNSLSYFSKCFKEKFGVLPSAYLKSR